MNKEQEILNKIKRLLEEQEQFLIEIYHLVHITPGSINFFDWTAIKKMILDRSKELESICDLILKNDDDHSNYSKIEYAKQLVDEEVYFLRLFADEVLLTGNSFEACFNLSEKLKEQILRLRFSIDEIDR